MARKVQHSVRWEGWIASAIDAWARENGNKIFSESVNYLLACELSRRGYTREFYEPGVVDAPEEKGEPAVDYSNSNIGNNSANVKSSVTNIATSPVDNMGILGDVLIEARRLSTEDKEKLLKYMRTEFKNKPK
jgi:hypothetical protein